MRGITTALSVVSQFLNVPCHDCWDVCALLYTSSQH